MCQKGRALFHSQIHTYLLPTYLSINQSFSLSLSIYLYQIYLIYLSFYLIYPSISQYIYLIYLSIYQYLYLSIYLSINMPLYQYISLSIYLSVYQFIYLYLSIYLSTHHSINLCVYLCAYYLSSSTNTLCATSVSL